MHAMHCTVNDAQGSLITIKSQLNDSRSPRQYCTTDHSAKLYYNQTYMDNYRETQTEKQTDRQADENYKEADIDVIATGWPYTRTANRRVNSLDQSRQAMGPWVTLHVDP